jgi:hypothetical protein
LVGSQFEASPHSKFTTPNSTEKGGLAAAHLSSQLQQEVLNRRTMIQAGLLEKQDPISKTKQKGLKGWLKW